MTIEQLQQHLTRLCNEGYGDQTVRLLAGRLERLELKSASLFTNSLTPETDGLWLLANSGNREPWKVF